MAKRHAEDAEEGASTGGDGSESAAKPEEVAVVVDEPTESAHHVRRISDLKEEEEEEAAAEAAGTEGHQLLDPGAQTGNHMGDQETVVQQYLQSQQASMQPAQPLSPSEIDLRELQAMPPDGGWGWVVVVGSFLSMIIVDGICFSFGIFLNDLEESFQASKQKITWCSSLLTGCYLLAGPGASALVNQYGFRLVVITGGVCAAASFMAASFIRNLDAFIVVYGVCGGLSFGLIYLPGVTIVGHWFSTRRASATGIAVCGSGVGMIIFGFISPIIMDEYTWRGALMLFSAFILNCAVAGALFMPLEKYQKQKADEAAMQRQHELIAKAAAAMAGDVNGSSCGAVCTNNGRSTDFEGPAKAGEAVSPAQDTEGKKGKRKKKAKKPPSSKRKIAIHRGSIMQKIIEEKERQRTTSVGSLDGMIITRENKLIEAPVDYNDKPMLSMNAIHRIMDNVIRRQYDRRSTGSSGILVGSGQVSASSAGRSRQNSARGGASAAAAAALKSSMPHLVNEYIQSQQSLQRDNVNRASCLPAAGPGPAASQWASVISLDPWMERLGGGAPLPPAEMAAAKEEVVAQLRREIQRPMNRKDFLYSGSMLHVPEFVSQPDVRSYIRSVTNLPDEPNQAKADIQRLFDIGIFRSRTFLLLSLSSIFSMLGFLIPYIFVADYAMHMGISKHRAGQLISIIGFANTFGRVASGVLSDQPWADCLWINNISMILAGLFTMLLPLFRAFGLLALYSVVFGLCIAAFASLRSIILVELLGLDKLTNAFGFLLLFQGVAIIVGPPFAGSFYDRSNSFDSTFVLGGAFMMLSGFICIPIRRLARWEARREARLALMKGGRIAGSSECSDQRDPTQVDQCVSAV